MFSFGRAVFVPHFNDEFLPNSFREEIDARARSSMQSEEAYREMVERAKAEHEEEERRLGHVAITRYSAFPLAVSLRVPLTLAATVSTGRLPL